MTTNSLLCPSCGAPAAFAWRFAVQTACPYCRAVLIRHDVNVEMIGEAAELPASASPIQLGTEGRFENRNFRVIGCIRYEAENAEWNEWHLAFFDSRQPENGWLSDAQAQYAVSFLVRPKSPLPTFTELPRGATLDLDGVRYTVTHRTLARYVGFQGELPFTTAGREESLFLDLRTADARFGTIDYSEDPPLLFLGRQIPFDELHLVGLREFEGW
jgi:hypothetical protein